MFEQPIMVVDNSGQEHPFRRIRVLLEKATRDGDKEIFIITNLPAAVRSQKYEPMDNIHYSSIYGGALDILQSR